MLKVRFESNINGVVEISDHGNVDMSAFLELLHTEPEKLSEGQPNMNEEGGCDEKDDYIPEKVMVRNFTLKELQRYFTALKGQMMKWWKLNPNLKEYSGLS